MSCLYCKEAFETWVGDHPISQQYVDKVIYAPCLVVLLNIESETVVDEDKNIEIVDEQEGELSNQEDIFLSLEDLGETGELGLNWSNPQVLQQPILMDDVYMGDSEPEPIPVEEDQLDENQKLFLIMEDLCENHDDTLDWIGGSEEMGDIEEVYGGDKCMSL